ncbi:MAG: flagellar basal body rod protein FlgC, partial [Gammaproteobacteria bacterium]|nr:flagellar basal body rod protein FlgC [Gammaproteobacteria bacterium]
MSLFSVFDVAGSAMNAQSVRMNVTSSNLANAGSVSGDPEKVYRARQPVFSTFQDNLNAVSGVSGVKLEGVIESSAPLTMRYQPDHPEADADGNVYVSNVNTIEEMVNMMSASRSYKNNVE